MLYVSAALDMRQYLRRVRAERYSEILSSEIAPSISMLVPAHNEEASIKESVRALLTVTYPQLEIVVVDDGSTDGTLSGLTSTFALVPIHPIYDRRIPTQAGPGHLPVAAVSQPDRGVEGEGRQGRLPQRRTQHLEQRAGLRHRCRHHPRSGRPPPPGAPFIRSHDVVAAGATIRVANGCTVTQGRLASERGPHRALAGIQAVEYLRAFLFGRPGWNRLGGNI